MDWSKTHYAKSADLHVAYQVLGDGELDLLILPYGLNISIDAHDEEPHWHTGEIEKRGDDIGGIAVHIASRVQAEAEPHTVLVSRVVTDLVGGSGLSFNPRGDYELKGVPGSWPLFTVDLWEGQGAGRPTLA